MVIFLVFSWLLKDSKLQKSRKHKENHHLHKIIFFFRFWDKVPGWRWPAGWLAWELARLAGLAGWLELAGRLGRGAGPEAWRGSQPSPARNFPKNLRKKEKQLISDKWWYSLCFLNLFKSFKAPQSEENMRRILGTWSGRPCFLAFSKTMFLFFCEFAYYCFTRECMISLCAQPAEAGWCWQEAGWARRQAGWPARLLTSFQASKPAGHL